MRYQRASLEVRSRPQEKHNHKEPIRRGASGDELPQSIQASEMARYSCRNKVQSTGGGRYEVMHPGKLRTSLINQIYPPEQTEAVRWHCLCLNLPLNQRRTTDGSIRAIYFIFSISSASSIGTKPTSSARQPSSFPSKPSSMLTGLIGFSSACSKKAIAFPNAELFSGLQMAGFVFFCSVLRSNGEASASSRYSTESSSRLVEAIKTTFTILT